MISQQTNKKHVLLDNIKNIVIKPFIYGPSLTVDQAKPDVRARGFYRAGQQAYFEIEVLNPNAESYS